jgi:hypothetical protein
LGVFRLNEPGVVEFPGIFIASSTLEELVGVWDSIIEDVKVTSEVSR